MAPVGGTKKVMGNKIATPLTEPKPGMAPIKSPTVHPIIISIRFNGSKAIEKPLKRRLRISIGAWASVQVMFKGFRFYYNLAG